MFSKKAKKRSEWFEGLLLAERVMSDSGSAEKIHLAIGSKLTKIPVDPKGIFINFWDVPKTELADGAMAFINFKKLK
jgi:hypothetical protein